MCQRCIGWFLRVQAQGTVDPSVGYIIHVKQVDLLGKVRFWLPLRARPQLHPRA